MTTEQIDTIEEIQDAVVIGSTANQPIKFSVTDEAIARMRTEFMPLSINGPDDKEGFKRVYDARQVVKKSRVDVDKKRKELNEDALEWQRKVNGEAKRITAQLEVIENHLALEEKAYNDERERIAREKALAQQMRTEGRVNQLREYGFTWNPVNEAYEFDEVQINFDDIKDLPDDEYEPVRYSAEYAYRLEQDRKAEIEAAIKAEEERIEAERKAEEERLATVAKQQEEERQRLQAIADQQAEAARKLEAERKQMEQDRKDALLRQRVAIMQAAGFTYNGFRYVLLDIWQFYAGEILELTDDQFEAIIIEAKYEVANAAEIAAEKIREQERDRIAAEQQREVERKQKEKEKADRKKRLAPDKVKLIAFADQLFALELPSFKNDEALQIAKGAWASVNGIANQLREQAETL